jgi:hypothetical protein
MQVTAKPFSFRDGASYVQLGADVSTRTGEDRMRIALIAAIAEATALAAIWSAGVITVASPKFDQSALVASPIDVMQMMKDAKTLPIEQYDAH